MWILKPDDLNGGTGITVHQDYESIIQAYKSSWARKMIIMKYIENPLTINSRKMDIRQFVLVTDWNPLQVWAYKESYVRIAVANYDPNTTDTESHLTNIPAEDNRISQVEFKKELAKNYGPNAWDDKVYPGLKESIKGTAKAFQNKIEHRKNSFEMFGYDYMLDDQLNVWLIEANRRPHLGTHGLPFKKELVQRLKSDIVKVVVDWAEDKSADTGGWELIPIDEQASGMV